MQTNNETPMMVDVDETDSSFIQTPEMVARQVPPQSSAYNLLASMIASSDSAHILPNTSQGLVLPLLSPSPTLPNMLRTPSPSASNFRFMFQSNQGKGNEPFPTEDISATSIKMEEQPEPAPAKPPPIKLKLKRVASNYIIETPKDVKLESTAIIDNTPTTQFSSPLRTESFATSSESSDMMSSVSFQPSSNVEQLIFPASEEQAIELLPSGSVSFPDVEHTAFPSGTVSTSVSGPPSVGDVQGIFQTLPGGATSSPGALDVVDTYEFDTALGKHAFNDIGLFPCNDL